MGRDDSVARCEGGRNYAGSRVLSWRFGGRSEAGVYVFVIVSRRLVAGVARGLILGERGRAGLVFADCL